MQKEQSDSETAAIRFREVVKEYAGAAKPAVAGVSLDIAAGDLVVLLGPSGCGKTTLLKMVNRLIDLTSGYIYINGTPIFDLPLNDLRRSIGYVIQNVGLFPHLDVQRNIAVVPELLKWQKPRITQRVAELLELVGLPAGEYASRYPRQLSGGQQQRVGLARALAADPAVMLMDEPFAAIDSITRRRLQDELLRVQRTVRKTILFVTHDVEEALRLADRIVVMCDGQVEQYDTPLRLLSQPANQFVAELVGSDDVLRGLSLLEVGAVMEAPKASFPPNIPKLLATADLRQAVGFLLISGAERLCVVDDSGATIGELSLDMIRQQAVSGKAEVG